MMLARSASEMLPTFPYILQGETDLAPQRLRYTEPIGVERVW